MSPPSCSVRAGASAGKRKSRAPVRAKRRYSPCDPTHAQATEPATKLGPPRYRSPVWAQQTGACAGEKDHRVRLAARVFPVKRREPPLGCVQPSTMMRRSEEHTSELQSRSDLVCRLLLEKKKKNDEQK